MVPYQLDEKEVERLMAVKNPVMFKSGVARMLKAILDVERQATYELVNKARERLDEMERYVKSCPFDVFVGPVQGLKASLKPGKTEQDLLKYLVEGKKFLA